MKLVLLALAAVVAVAAGQTCDSQGVTDSSSCDAQCSGSSCFCQYAEVNGVGSCACADGSGAVFACSDAGGSVSVDDDFTFGDDDFSFGDDDFNFFGDDDGSAPSVDQIRQGLIALLPAGCESAVNSAITSSVINCFATATSEFSVLDTTGDSFFSQTALDTVCASKCIGRVLSAVNTLYDAGCLAISNDDTFNAGLDAAFGELGLFEQYEAQLNIACAQGGDTYCGLIFDTLAKFYDFPDTFTASDCMTIVNSGKCLGTIDAALNSGTNLFGDDVVVDTQAVINGLTSTCDNMGVSGISEAASGTEAPANLASSSAATVSGAIAAVVALVAAAILA